MGSKGPMGRTLGMSLKADGANSGKALVRMTLEDSTLLEVMQERLNKIFFVGGLTEVHGRSQGLHGGMSLDNEICSPLMMFPVNCEASVKINSKYVEWI